MGNCLKGQSSDDVSLLRGGEGTRESSSSDQIHAEIYQEPNVPVYYPSPNVRRPVTQLTEEEQVKIAKRIGLIQNLPSGAFDGSRTKPRECVICMIEFVQNDMIRYMPCMHVYHVHCIDAWLMRSFTCPSCMSPVDGELFRTYSDPSYPQTQTSPQQL